MNQDTHVNGEEELRENVGSEEQVNAESVSENEAGTAEGATEPNYEQMYQESQDKLLRLFADFENLRKRSARERMEYVKTAGQDVFQAILPVLDDLDRAEKSIENAVDVTSVKEGVDLIIKKLRGSLTGKGLEEMQVVGENFDSEIHDAIAQIPAPSEAMKGKVLDCTEKGYKLNGTIIRIPKVVVGQ